MKKLNKNKIALGLATLVMGLGGNAMAAEETGTAQVNASILPSCAVSIMDNVSFQYNPAKATPEFTIKSVNVICTKTTTYVFGFNWGSGSVGNRRMMFGENLLQYRIIEVGKGSGDVGDIGDGKAVYSTSPGENQEFQFRFNIPARQYVPAGTYADNLVVTFMY